MFLYIKIKQYFIKSITEAVINCYIMNSIQTKMIIVGKIHVTNFVIYHTKLVSVTKLIQQNKDTNKNDSWAFISHSRSTYTHANTTHSIYQHVPKQMLLIKIFDTTRVVDCIYIGNNFRFLSKNRTEHRFNAIVDFKKGIKNGRCFLVGFLLEQYFHYLKV